MLELKDLLAEWKTVPELLGLEVGVEDTGNGKGMNSRELVIVRRYGFYLLIRVPEPVERRKTARNSLLDLQNLYRTQLQSLWTTISGSQKFLPLLPGRHLVCEAKNFVELNSATYKIKQNVELFLLSDLLLVAARKRKRGDEETKADKDGRLVAERCWNLTEVVIVDVKDSGGEN
jgi:exocyst complex component 8